MRFADTAELIMPDKLAAAAKRYRSRGNVGVAFTYNEPLIGYEYVRDTAKLVHEAGMVNVLVSNGTAELAVLDEILPYIDAMNIDLKGFTDLYYTEVLGGDRAMVMRFIEQAVQFCHVELTTLIIPGENDTEEEMREMCKWIAGLRGIVPGTEIPLHISRFFPRFHMTDRVATDVAKVYRLAEVAREKLSYVYTGNC
jgi:pyruvate formate lyase activating enzyme